MGRVGSYFEECRELDFLVQKLNINIKEVTNMVRLILDLLRKLCDRSEPKQQKITLVIGDVIIVNHKG